MRGSSQRASSSSSTENSTRVPSGGEGDIAPHAGSRLVERWRRVTTGWIRDARMVDPGEQRHEGLLDQGQVAQGEVAVVELAFFETLADDPLDQVFDRF